MHCLRLPHIIEQENKIFHFIALGYIATVEQVILLTYSSI